MNHQQRRARLALMEAEQTLEQARHESNLLDSRGQQLLPEARRLLQQSIRTKLDRVATLRGQKPARAAGPLEHAQML